SLWFFASVCFLLYSDVPFSSYLSGDHPDLHSFPTRRSSDLFNVDWKIMMAFVFLPAIIYGVLIMKEEFPVNERVKAGVSYLDMLDRKSTRLNSSHVSISYAVFCLKKKRKRKDKNRKAQRRAV